MGIKDGGKRPEPDHMNSGNSKSLIYYMVITMVITLLLNGLVFPSMMRQEILEVGYNDFLAMVDAGQVRQVQKGEEELCFLAEDANGKKQLYKTGLWEDPKLTERLYEAGVTFATVIP